MKIAFNPSTVAALITPPNNKDITFDLRGRNIFARGVKFCGTDTWRDIKINNVSIGSNILDLRNGSNTTLTNTNGVVTINSTWRPVVDNLTSDSTTSSLSANLGRVLKALIDGKSDSDHNHDDRYLRLTGGLMLGDITFGGDNKIIWGRNTDSASISFKNDGDGDADSYMSFVTSDNGNEYFRWSHSSGPTNTEWMALRSDGLRVGGTKVSLEGHSHNDLYYTKTEVNNKLNGKSDTSHTHDDRYLKLTGGSMTGTLSLVSAGSKPLILNNSGPGVNAICVTSNGLNIKNLDGDRNDSGINIDLYVNGYKVYNTNNLPAYPTSLKNPHALTISLNGTSQGPYDGSASKSINITPSSIGAATSEHNHDNRYLKLTGGTMQLGEGLKFHADENYFGTNSDARIISLLDWNDKICDGGLIIDERGTFEGKEYVTELLRIRHSEFKWKGSNILHSGNSNINGNTITINGSSLTVSKSDHTHNIYATNENYGGFTKSGRLPTSGFYQPNESESGGNAPWSSNVHLINCLHSNTGNNYALLIAASFYDNNIFKIRVTNNNVNNTWRDIIHSGNIGSQLVKGAYMTPLTLNLEKLISSGYLASDYTNRYDTVEYMKAAAKYLLKNYPGYSVFGTMYPNGRGFFTANIYGNGFNSNGNPEHITIHYYPHGGDIINCGTTYGSWYYSGINRDGSSYKLQTARKIWGQSFDGTADISGTLSGVAHILFSADNAYDIGSNSAASKHIYTYWLGAKSGLKLELGANNSSPGLGLCIDTNLYVGIGTNTPGEKLDVRGKGYFTLGILSAANISVCSNVEEVSPNRAAIEIRERDRGTTDIAHNYKNAPRIGFHWGLRYWGNLALYNSEFNFLNDGCSGYFNIVANGFKKSNSNDYYVLLGGGGHSKITDLSVSNADTVDGYHASGLLTALSNSNNGISITVGGTTKSVSDINVNGANTILGTSPQIAAATEYNSIYVSSPGYSTNKPVKMLCFDWYSNYWALSNIRSGNTDSAGFGVFFKNTEIARFTSDGNLSCNVASATKLKTPRSIWGQSFDGTNDITGSLYLSGYLYMKFGGEWLSTIDNDGNGPIFGHALAGKNRRAYYTGSPVYICGGSYANYGYGITVNSSNNVGLGITSPSYKLHVAGDIYTTTGFKKNGSSDSYVLLGGGGHKAESALRVSYASSAGSVAWDNVTGKPTMPSNITATEALIVTISGSTVTVNANLDAYKTPGEFNIFGTSNGDYAKMYVQSGIGDAFNGTRVITQTIKVTISHNTYAEICDVTRLYKSNAWSKWTIMYLGND